MKYFLAFLGGLLLGIPLAVYGGDLRPRQPWERRFGGDLGDHCVIVIRHEPDASYISHSTGQCGRKGDVWGDWVVLSLTDPQKAKAFARRVLDVAEWGSFEFPKHKK